MREPVRVAGCSRQLQAVTWNSGVGAMYTFCAGGGVLGAAGGSTSPAATALPSATAVAVPMNTRFIRLCTEPRWVSWAPFGNPVVPEV